MLNTTAAIHDVRLRVAQPGDKERGGVKLILPCLICGRASSGSVEYEQQHSKTAHPGEKLLSIYQRCSSSTEHIDSAWMAMHFIKRSVHTSVRSGETNSEPFLPFYTVLNGLETKCEH